MIRFIVVILCTLSLSSVYAHAQEPTRILLFGDSIIAGYGLSQDQSLPKELERLLNTEGAHYTVINGGISGDTTTGGRNRLAWSVAKHKPDLVFLALGGNDVLRGIRPQTIESNIIAMLEWLEKENIPTILSAVEAPANIGLAYRGQLGQVYKKAAKAYDVPLYPFLLKDTFGNKTLMLPDSIHPNARGVEVIARKLADYISSDYINQD